MSKPLKKALRELIRLHMMRVTQEEIHLQSENISKVLRQLPEYNKASRIAYYLHMETGEIETTTMIENAFNDKKQVFLPRIVDLINDKHFEKQTKQLKMLEVGSMRAIDELTPQGKYKLREPADSNLDCFAAGGLDMIVLPGMGFTKRCERIGHGKGFYDSFIIEHLIWSRENGRPEPFLVAVGAQEQLVEEIPTEAHDRNLNAVIINDLLFRRDG